MAKVGWRESNKLFAKLYPCIENRASMDKNEHELCLVGRYGEIWESGVDSYKAVILSTRMVRQWLPESQWNVSAGDEVVINFGKDGLPEWVEKLEVFRYPSSMLSKMQF